MIKQEFVTDEMIQWYEERTRKHIMLVQKYCRLINAWEEARFNHGFILVTDPSFGGTGIELNEIAIGHDVSKLIYPEVYPYIWITWNYKCKDEGKEFLMPDYIKIHAGEATFHHVKNNPHHPEYWDDEVKMEKREDRDIPTRWSLANATKMPDIYIAEMVADWLAMSEEKGTSVKNWADKNVNIRWKFTDEQKNLIYELINNILVKKEGGK